MSLFHKDVNFMCSGCSGCSLSSKIARQPLKRLFKIAKRLFTDRIVSIHLVYFSCFLARFLQKYMESFLSHPIYRMELICHFRANLLFLLVFCKDNLQIFTKIYEVFSIYRRFCSTSIGLNFNQENR